MIVADTNLIVALMIDGPLNVSARRWAFQEPVWVVPVLWKYEFTNVVRTQLLAGVILPDQASRVLEDALEAFTPHEHSTDQLEVLDLSLRLRISPYDANFILLAQQLKTVCVTNDRQMLERAKKYTRGITQKLELDSLE